MGKQVRLLRSLRKNRAVVSKVVIQLLRLPKKFGITWPGVFLAVTLTLVVAGGLVSSKALSDINRNIAEAKEAARPANVGIVEITVTGCADCFKLDEAIATFKKQPVSVTGEKSLSYDSPEARALIKQYSITRVPTYIVTGEVTKSNILNFIQANGVIKDNAFVFTKVTPLSVDPETKQEMGRVVVTILTDPSCRQCVDPRLTIEGFKKSGVKITEQREVVWNSPEGQQLIAHYQIAKLPTFIFSPQFDLYRTITGNWKNFGTVEADQFYVARNLPLPYRDLTKGQVVGLVDLIYLTDASCTDCYKVQAVQKPILTQGYGVALSSERTVDVSSAEGQDLVKKHKITKIPTILLSPEADEYTNLQNVWKNVGTVDPDGWYVFRQMSQLRGATYKDLETNQIVGGAGSSPSASPGRGGR